MDRITLTVEVCEDGVTAPALVSSRSLRQVGGWVGGGEYKVGRTRVDKY